MTQADSPSATLTDQLAHFVPAHAWFSQADPKNVVAQVFRVYGEPFAHRSYLPSAFLLTDFELLRVRAAFVRAEMLLPDFDTAFHVFPTPDGGTEVGPQTVRVTFEGERTVRWTEEMIWHSTGDGTLLLLLTPSLTQNRVGKEGPPNVPYAVTEALTLARAAIIATMGRNAAFEQLFECEVLLEEHTSALNLEGRGRLYPDNYGRPSLNGINAELSERFVEKVEGLDE